MAAGLGGAAALPRPDRPGRAGRQAEVLRPRHVPVPVGRGPARRPPGGLHRDRHRRALQAHAGLQRAAPDGLGRLRPARRARRDAREHPPARSSRRRNIDNFRRQIKRLGFCYDWEREVDTTDPDYYRWTQWIFLKLFERGLAYVAEMPVNWCPALGTVLANEEVKDGKYVETGDPVERRTMRQWMLRITAYAERLLDDLDGLDWPEASRRCSATGSASRSAPRSTSRVAGRDATVPRSSRRGPTRSSARPTGARARAPAGRRRSPTPRAARGGRRLRRRGGAASRAARAGRDEGEDRRVHRRLRAQPGQRRARCRSGSPTTC